MLKLSGTVAAGSVLAAACGRAVAPTVAPTPVPPTVAPTAVPPTVAPTKIPPTSAPAPAGPVTLEVLDPSGAFEVTALHAKRLDTLAGKTICFLSDDEWQAWRTFPLIADLLKKAYPTIKIVDWKEFPRDGDHGYPDFDKNPGLLKSKGCDGVILGNAG